MNVRVVNDCWHCLCVCSVYGRQWWYNGGETEHQRLDAVPTPQEQPDQSVRRQTGQLVRRQTVQSVCRQTGQSVCRQTGQFVVKRVSLARVSNLALIAYRFFFRWIGKRCEATDSDKQVDLADYRYWWLGRCALIFECGRLSLLMARQVYVDFWIDRTMSVYGWFCRRRACWTGGAPSHRRTVCWWSSRCSTSGARSRSALSRTRPPCWQVRLQVLYIWSALS